MATTKAILDDAELAKSYITNSRLSDEYKRLYLRLINLSTLATNGISPEEKIQRMTECIQLLAVTQGMYLANIDEKIEKVVESANRKQCLTCKAMKHAEKAEQEQHDKELVKRYLGNIDHAAINESEECDENVPFNWSDLLKTLLLKPYIYVTICVLTISPYGVDIIKTLCQYFAK